MQSRPYTAEIIAVGTELLLGQVVNTNARDISQMLSELGINVYYHTVVGDNATRLKQAVEIALSRSDIIIATGGLGPTHDDITKQTLAEMFGKKMIFNEDVANKIREFFKKRLHNVQMTDNNFRQAEFPEGSVIFENEVGTAPGCAFEADDKFLIMIPGPPRECRSMLKTGVMPYLQKLSHSELHSHNIHIFGLGESVVESKLRDLMQSLTNPTLAPYAQDGELMLRVTAKASSKEDADAMMTPILEKVQETLGDIIYGIDTGSLENTVALLLAEYGKTIATAESCTGGLVSKRLTDIPGISAVYKGGFAVYSDSSKIALLDIDEDLLKEKGAISRDAALAMADSARKKLKADIGISVTGIAGPDTDESGAEVGTMFVALTTKDASYCRSLHLFLDRDRIRISAASHALDMVRRYLTGLEVVQTKG